MQTSAAAKCILFALGATLAPPMELAPCVAQTATVPVPAAASEPGWKISITPYLWVPAQDGTLTVGGASADVDLDVADTFDTIRDHFNIGLCLHAEVSRERFSIFGDVMYLSLESSDVPTQAGLVDVRQDQAIGELGLAYAVIDAPVDDGEMRWRLEPLAGARVWYLAGNIDVPGPDNDLDGDEAWIDGFAGARTRFTFNRTLALVARGDLGAGSSDFTWSALGALEINFTSQAWLTLGYRALDDDYSTGSGDSRFAYDMLLHGPFIAFTLRF